MNILWNVAASKDRTISDLVQVETFHIPRHFIPEKTVSLHRVWTGVWGSVFPGSKGSV